MSKINVRSPYLINAASVGLDSAELELFIIRSGEVITYNLDSVAVNESVTFEISDIVRDYTENSFDGSYSSSVVDVIYRLTEIVNGNQQTTVQVNLTAFDGYGYFEEGTNPQNNSIVLQSNKTIYANDFANITFPIHVIEDTTVTYFKDGESIFTKVLEASIDFDKRIQYVSNSALDYDVFYNRVLDDGGIIEAFSCVREIANDFYQDFDADTIHVEQDGSVDVIRVKEIEECKHNPYKVTFINKYGALQDLWFFKKSSLSMKTKQDSYKANIASLGSYSVNDRQNYIFNKTGTESLKLNTGFYPEEYNEVFRQLSLSEEVWINYENKTLPINVSSTGLNYKTRVNDKLINYTIDVEFSNDKINNIR